MAPFGGEPAVVEVQPADHSADVEGAEHGVDDVRGTRDTGAIRNGSARDDGAEQVAAGGEFKGFEAAAQGVEEDEAGSVDLEVLSMPDTIYYCYAFLTAKSESTLYL